MTQRPRSIPDIGLRVVGRDGVGFGSTDRGLRVFQSVAAQIHVVARVSRGKWSVRVFTPKQAAVSFPRLADAIVWIDRTMMDAAKRVLTGQQPDGSIWVGGSGAPPSRGDTVLMREGADGFQIKADIALGRPMMIRTALGVMGLRPGHTMIARPS